MIALKVIRWSVSFVFRGHCTHCGRADLFCICRGAR